EIAAIIIEPVCGNMGCILPKENYLESLRKICTQEDIIFIFDEVMTGFRLAQGGAQERLKIDADLITYGKVIGAGMPVGAFGGKAEIMQHIAPLGNVYQAGTLSGNPIAMIAGFTLLNHLKNNPSIYDELDAKGKHLKDGLQKVFDAANIPVVINQLGSMLSVFFTNKSVNNFDDAGSSNIAFFNKFFHAMLDEGIYLPPSGYESWFLSNVLSYDDLNMTIDAAKKAVKHIVNI
ncbi:MAG: aminotransferase class III-fold pyridoxal phosphate-dependent enzyme, partial [Parafilimonas sp.]